MARSSGSAIFPQVRFVIIRIYGGFVTGVTFAKTLSQAAKIADRLGSGLRSYNMDASVVFDRYKDDVVWDGVGSDLPPNEREAQFR